MRTIRRMVRPAATSAFTLIELMLVLVILTALAAIVIPKFTGRAKEAHITTAKTQISNFMTALSTFEMDCGRYPTTEEGLQALVTQPVDVQNWHKSLDRIPNDPWGHPYIYQQPGQHNQDGYDLYSCGPDGQEGGVDDITNWEETE